MTTTSYLYYTSVDIGNNINYFVWDNTVCHLIGSAPLFISFSVFTFRHYAFYKYNQIYNTTNVQLCFFK